MRPNAPFYGGATQLLVTRTLVVDGERWLEVLLPVRPNGTRGWIRADVTRLSTTSLRIVVNLSARRLILYRANRIVLRAPVAIGEAGTPDADRTAVRDRRAHPDQPPPGLPGAVRLRPHRLLGDAQRVRGRRRPRRHPRHQPAGADRHPRQPRVHPHAQRRRRAALAARARRDAGRDPSLTTTPAMLVLPDPPLTDPHVVLRAFHMADVEVLVASSNDPLVQLYTRVPTPYTADDARDFVTGAPARRLFDEALDLAVASPERRPAAGRDRADRGPARRRAGRDRLLGVPGGPRPRASPGAP